MPNLFADVPSTAASISSIDGVNISEGMQRNLVNNSIRGLAAMVKTNFAASANTITASAGLFNLASISAGDYVLMAPPSGGSITSFGAASDGLQKYLHSTGTTLLRNGASLSVQGGADISLVAGDLVWARRDQGIWRARIQQASPVRTDLANTFTAAQTINVTAAAPNALVVIGTDDGATGPLIIARHVSTSPALNDAVGLVDFQGRDTGGNNTTYGRISGQISSPTDGAEYGQFAITTIQNASLGTRVLIGNGIYTPNTTGTDKGADTINALGLYVNGHGTVAQVVRDSEATYTTCSTDLPVDNSSPGSAEGDEILSVAITPTNASSMIVVRFTGMVGASGGGNGGVAAFNNTTAIDARAFEIRVSTSLVPVALEVAESAGSTSPRTYSVRVGPAVGGPASIFLNGDASSRIFGGTAKASLEVYEILPQ